MIPRSGIVEHFQKMLTDKWGYIPNTAGVRWTQAKQDSTKNAMAQRYGSKWIGHMVADCSGAFVYAYKQYGESIYHGSNRIARRYVAKILPISEAKAGMVAFKYIEVGQKGYDLPSYYRKGGSQYTGDLNDYYHIGLVDDDPNYVLNSATTQNGFIRSKITNGWNACGYLKAVNYGGERPVIDNNIAYVTSPNGKPVNMRRTANVTSDIVYKVPVGAEVHVIGTASNGWTNIMYKTYKGWMMSQYLTDGEIPAQDAQNTDGQENLQATIKALETHILAIKAQTDAALEMLSTLE